MRDDMESIRYRIGDLGYAFVRVTPDLDKNQDKEKLDLFIMCNQVKSARERCYYLWE